MSKRTVPDLKELFKQASEIAQQVPESMQEAAFNRAIDLLTGDTQPEPVAERTGKKRIGKQKASTRTGTKEEESSVNDLLSAINSTEHPEVKSASKVLDRSLMVLQIALTDHSVDGLGSGEIAKILTEKFRISTTSTSVSMALGRATNLVDRIRDGQSFSYKIMAPGEEYLAHLGEAESSLTATTARRKARKRPAAKKNKREASTTEVGSKKKARKTKQKKPVKSSGRKTSRKSSSGPSAAIVNLIDSGFFSEGRTGPEVQTYLKNKRGFNFETDHLRMTMLRFVRDGKLNRDENTDGQYEYKTPSA